MADNKEKLFADFPPVATQDWMDKIMTDLKGADFEKKLVWRTNEGFKVKPFYRREDLEGLKTTDALPGQFPYLRGNKKDHNTWYIRQDIRVDDPVAANAKALDLLNKGVDSLGFLSLEAAHRIAIGCKLHFCDACFSGTYPMEVPEQAEKNIFESEI